MLDKGKKNMRTGRGDAGHGKEKYEDWKRGCWTRGKKT
jgi:hypothetical protein